MVFAIISDTHDNTANFNKAINFLNKENIGLILHCGDITNKETIEEANKSFKGDIKFIRGNGDYNLDDVPESVEITLDGKNIFLNHYPEISKKMAESGKYDLCFYGHTHRPWEEKIGNCRLVNPGELAGQRYKPCFAIYDTESDKLELKILEKV
ncbi:MAG: metallophosphoesterase [Patescibacteria group bacterium]